MSEYKLRDEERERGREKLEKVSWKYKTENGKKSFTSPNVLNREQLFESSEECSPDAREEESFTSVSDFQ